MDWKPIRYRDIKSDADRWRWYAETYAFFRVLQGVPHDVRTCAVDPSGDWFNETLVNIATENYRRWLKGRNAGIPTAEAADMIRQNAWRYERAEQWRTTGVDPGPEPSFAWLEEYRP